MSRPHSPLNILVLSAYHAASHAYWLDGLVTHLPDHHWTCLTLPPRHFKWRIRGNGLTWAYSESERLRRPYDLLIATSMVDLATLRGLVPELSQIPTIVYCHENQFAYPTSLNQKRQSIEPQLVNLYTALCADSLVFNSDYNRQSFIDGTETLLAKLPDGIPAGLEILLQQKTQVLPVPLDRGCFHPNSAPDDTFHLVWNHRWEYDKGPDRLLACLQQLPASLTLTVHVVGQSFRTQPAEFEQIKQLLEERQWLGNWGYIDSRGAYLQQLSSFHCVLSTSLHDFQGLAMLEASAAGCTPAAPDRLAYRDFLPASSRYASHPDDREAEADAAARHLEELYHQWKNGHRPTAVPTNLSWDKLRSEFQSLFYKTVEYS